MRPVAFALTLLCSASALAAPQRECAPCGPTECLWDSKTASAARELLRKRILRGGDPARLVNPLVDKIASCEKCLKPDAIPGLNILEVKGPRQWKSIPWTKTDERITRADLRSGKIKAFYIMLQAEACTCCEQKKAVWTRQSEPKKRKDWDKRFEFNRDFVIAFEDGKKLGPDPADLKE